MKAEKRQTLINLLTARDIEDIRATDDNSFLVAVLQGEEFKPYSQFSDEELNSLYKEVRDQFTLQTH